MPSPSTRQPAARIQIQDVRPQVDCGRYPVKLTQGDPVELAATIFKDGHEILRAVVRYRAAGSRNWQERPLEPVGNDRWQGSFEPSELGRWQYSIEAWVDRFATMLDELDRKLAAGQVELAGETAEAELLFGPGELEDWHAAAPGLGAKDRHGKVSSATLEVDVERERARFGAWYELFPRSWGGFKGVEKVLPQLAELGFDVLYLPPIHPIGTTNRKGRNNAPAAKEGDPGSPWAIGRAEGGHEAINSELGSVKDFERMVARGHEVGCEICIDFAIQASPDHPWLTQHPEWFNRRPDGTLKYAENPPKRYEDIYNVNWDSPDCKGLWEALRDVVRHWADRGVRIFRVDNPHTKPIAFWEWLIAELRAEHPQIIFLAEAFTRAAMMRMLAKVGFNQSYTYFTWKSSKWELTDYVTELASSGMQDYYRPNFFVNTPDILTEELQTGGAPKFASRLVLAATLSPSYGVYSGYESFERVPVRAGSEEYDHSEKYEVKARTLDGPLLTLISRMNTIRRENPAFQELDNIEFLTTENDALIAYAKRTHDNTIISVVTLDPATAQEGVVVVPYGLGLAPVFTVTDLLSGESFDWRMGRNFVRLDPYRVAHLLRVS